MFKTFASTTILVFLTSCATIVNDAEVPVTLSFSDGSSGSCKLSNKRAQYQVDIPGTQMVRRSDDALKFDCICFLFWVRLEAPSSDIKSMRKNLDKNIYI